MARKGTTRRQRAATAAQRQTPRAIRETAPRPAEPVGQSRPSAVRILVRHLIWFLPFYAGLLSAAYLVRTFYATGLQDPRWMMGALAAAAGALLLEYPWVRMVQHRRARGPGVGEPQKQPAGSRP